MPGPEGPDYQTTEQMSESQEHGGRWGGSQRTRATFRAVECANIRSAARNTLGQPTLPENWTRIAAAAVGFPKVLKRFAFICVKTQLIFVLDPIDCFFVWEKSKSWFQFRRLLYRQLRPQVRDFWIFCSQKWHFSLWNSTSSGTIAPFEIMHAIVLL